MEFLTRLTITVPADTSDATVEVMTKAEAARTAELAAQGQLLRLWRPPLQPGERRTLGLFRADDEEHLRAIIATLPMHIWMTVGVTPLAPHPNDPAAQRVTEPSAGARR
jgi:muconolactone D-isomerase